MVSEHSVQDEIIDYLRLCGHLVTRVNSGRRGYTVFYRWWPVWTQALVDTYTGLSAKFPTAAPFTSGKADVECILNPTGQYCAIEVKRPGKNRVSDEQILYLAMVEACGGRAIKAESVEDVIKALE